MRSHRMFPAVLIAAVVVLGPALTGCSSGSGSGSDSGSGPRSSATPGDGAKGPLGTAPGVPPEGRTTVTYTVRSASAAPLSDEELRRTADRLKARAKAFGLTGTTIEVRGGAIIADAPGDSADELRQMATTAQLAFRPVLD
ncbi:MAG TPA: hypothetical protein VIW71_17010, partial [Streptomyces sp.]